MNNNLAVALLSLLIVLIALDVTALVIAMLSSSGFGWLVFVDVWLDDIIIALCVRARKLPT